MLIEPAIDDVEKGRQGVLLSRSSPQWLPNLCPEQEAGLPAGKREQGQGTEKQEQEAGNREQGQRTERQEQEAGREGGGIVYC